MPKISVIIPVYNSAQYLPKCLDTVCGQTFRDIEIICVNDSSTDESFSILQEYAKNDARIKLINLEENKGAAVARNIAIKHSRGEYLGFIDSDDFIDLNFYEKLYERAVKTGAEVVKGNIINYCPKTKLRIRESWIDINNSVKRHKANFAFSFTTAIYKTSLIKEKEINFLEGLVHFEDPYFTIKAALFYQKLEVINDIFYYYVNNPDSASRKKIYIKHIESLIVGIHKVIDILDEHCSDKTHYLIVFNFLLDQLLCFCNKFDTEDQINILAVNALPALYQRCRYKTDCLQYYFLRKKKNHQEEVIKQLKDKVKNDFKNS